MAITKSIIVLGSAFWASPSLHLALDLTQRRINDIGYFPILIFSVLF